MIDNIVLLLRGAMSGKPVKDLLARCHPLGKFPVRHARLSVDLATCSGSASAEGTWAGFYGARGRPRPGMVLHNSRHDYRRWL